MLGWMLVSRRHFLRTHAAATASNKVKSTSPEMLPAIAPTMRAFFLGASAEESVADGGDAGSDGEEKFDIWKKSM